MSSFGGLFKSGAEKRTEWGAAWALDRAGDPRAVEPSIELLHVATSREE